MVAVALYVHTLSFGYTNHDDDLLISRNMEFISDISNIPEAFTTDAWYQKRQIELYRPLQSVSYILDAQWGENVAFTAHLTNLILHILNCLSVFYLLLLFRIDIRLSLIGALIYTVHFLLLHAVIWIPARGDLLLALFSFLTVITFIRLEKSPGKWYWYLLNVLFFFLALFSKETAILLPVVLILYKFFISNDRKFRQGYLFLLLSWFVIYLFFTYLRNISVSEDGKALGIMALLLNLRTIPETIAKYFVPVNFSTMPSFRADATIAGLLILAAITAFFLFRRKQFSKPVMFGLLWFVMFLLPGMVYRPEFAFYTYEYLDHRAYLPFFGFLMAGMLALQQLQLRNSLLWGIAIPFLLYLTGVNIWLSRVYHDPLSFSELAIKTNPRSALARFIHGNQIFSRKDTIGAFNDFTLALNVYPEFADARFNRAMIFFYRKQFAESKADFDTLLQYKPEYGDKAYVTRGEASLRLNDIMAAIRDYETALKINPTNGKTEQRLAFFRDLVANAPPEPDYLVRANDLNNRGITEAKKGNFKEALALFTKAVEAYPQFSKAIINVGNCRDAMGDRAAACLEWKKAAAMGNSDAVEMVEKLCR